MNCVNLKQKFNKKFECKLTNKEIKLSECKNCGKFEIKPIPKCNLSQTNKCCYKELKTHSKLAVKKQYKYKPKKDKNLNSIMPKSDEYSNVYIKGYEKHHCICGRNRDNSEKYGLFVWLPTLGHDHDNIKLIRDLKILAQKQWELYYGSREEFIKIFGKSFIHKKKD